MARGVGGGGGVKISHFVPSLSESPREIILRLERTNRCGVPSPVPWCGLPCPSVPSQTLIGSRGPGVNGQPQAAPSSRHRSRPSVSRVPTGGSRRGRRDRRTREDKITASAIITSSPPVPAAHLLSAHLSPARLPPAAHKSPLRRRTALLSREVVTRRDRERRGEASLAMAP